ncbi:MAG: hypothetical protein JW812_02905 [Alphaproteobacteria bacterium]|nr:hypothetical protein [Alphaproteobacteria bacterium]MBN2779577.1 hypothetical protein [Alphaproteobacteria bacterium]
MKKFLTTLITRICNQMVQKAAVMFKTAEKACAALIDQEGEAHAIKQEVNFYGALQKQGRQRQFDSYDSTNKTGYHRE